MVDAAIADVKACIEFAKTNQDSQGQCLTVLAFPHFLLCAFYLAASIFVTVNWPFTLSATKRTLSPSLT